MKKKGMFDKECNQKIKKELRKETEPVMDVYEETWDGIENQLFDQLFEKKKTNKKRKKKKWMAVGSTAAACGLLSFTLFTDSGEAMITSIKEYFEPEKEIVFTVEGEQEKQNVVLKEKDPAYVIYVDEEVYTYVKEGKTATVAPVNPMPEGVPAAFMSLTPYSGKTSDNMLEEVKKEAESENLDMVRIENIATPSKGIEMIAIQKTETPSWDDAYVRYTILSKSDTAGVVIKSVLFREAVEGHGARFQRMIETLQFKTE
jgi:hypothetical protein